MYRQTLCTLIVTCATSFCAAQPTLLYRLESDREFGRVLQIDQGRMLASTESSFDLLDVATGTLNFSYADEYYGVNSDGFSNLISLKENNAVILGRPNGTQPFFARSYSVDTHDSVIIQQKVPTVDNSFGSALSTNGEIVAVGAPTEGFFRGAVYLFDAFTGDQINRIETEASSTFRLGQRMASDDNWLAIQAETGNSNRFVTVYDYDQDEMVFEFTTENDEFLGNAMDINDSRLISSAKNANNFAGKAYVHSLETGEVISELAVPNTEPRDFFGESVAMDGNIAVVGAPGGLFVEGAAYVFEVDSGRLLHTLTAPSGRLQSEFGYSVAVDGDYIAVSAQWTRDGDEAAIYVYQIPEPSGLVIALMLFAMLSSRGTTSSALRRSLTIRE